MILAIDSTTNTLSICIKVKNEYIKKNITDNPKHSLTILPTIDSLLRENNLSIKEVKKIIVALGPGSFTGIRVGISTALGLSNALNIELYGVSTLRALSYYSDTNYKAVAIDSRRDMVYASYIDDGKYNEVNELLENFKRRIDNDTIYGIGISGDNIIEIIANGEYLIRAYLDGYYTKEIKASYLREAEATRKLREKND